MPLRLVLLVLDGFSLRHCTHEIAPNLVGLPRKASTRRPAADPCFPPRRIRTTRRWRPAPSRSITASMQTTRLPTQASDPRGISGRAASRSSMLPGPRVCGQPYRSATRTSWASWARSLRCALAARWHVAARHPHYSRLRGQRRALSRTAGHARRRCRRRAVPARQHGWRLTRVRSGFRRGEAGVHRGRRTRRSACRSAARGARWIDTIVAVVSDHGQITADLSLPPIDVPGALARTGIEAEVIEEGSGALVRAVAIDRVRKTVSALDGVADVLPFAPDVLYAHARPGRGVFDAQAAHPGNSWVPGDDRDAVLRRRRTSRDSRRSAPHSLRVRRRARPCRDCLLARSACRGRTVTLTR